jgi:16S rRNA (uracil1498-N3)-methyltransferase
VNLLLVEPAEVVDGRIALRDSDRRVHHLRSVLGVTVGSRIRAGIVGGNVGSAEVVADGDGIVLALDASTSPRAILPVQLVLAMPRPKVLTRVIESAAAFGVERIDLTNAWRVDKSYLHSPRVDPDALALAARFGAEQGATTHVPPIEVHLRLMPLLDRWTGSGSPGPDLRLIAHPGAPPIERAYRRGPVVLAIGPEGGWIEREVETFCERGFLPVSLGAAILRVEGAVAAALAQLDLLARTTEP